MGVGVGIGFGGAAAVVSEEPAVAVFFVAVFFVAAFFAGFFFAAVFFTAFLAVVFRAGFAAFGGDSAVGMSKRSSVVFLLIRESVGKRVCAVP